VKPKVAGLMAVACALLATAASRAGPMAGDLGEALQASGAAPEAALEQPSALPRSALPPVPFSLGRLGDLELLTVRPAAIFGGTISLANFAEEALGPASRAARVLGISAAPKDALRPASPLHTRAEALRPLHSRLAFRGELEGLLPLGAGLIGIGVLGRRPTARVRTPGSRRSPA
jgi:hypothetical protein